MSGFNFGGKPAGTGTPAGGFPQGGTGIRPGTGGGFSFGTPKTTAATTGSTGGFSFGTPGGVPGSGTSSQPPASTTGGFTFGAPNIGGTPAPTGTGGFSLGGASSLGATPSTQAASSARFSLAGPSLSSGATPTAAGTQAAPSAGFSLASTTTNPSTGVTQAHVHGGFSLSGPTLSATANTGGTQGGGILKLGTPSLGAASTTATSTVASGVKLGLGTTTTTTGGLGLGGALTSGAGVTAASTTAAPTSLASILKPGTATPATKPGLGLSLAMPAKTTSSLMTGTTASSGFSLGLGAKTTSTTAITTTSSTLAAAAGGAAGGVVASTGPKMSYQQLEQAINKWTVELEEQEKLFLKQATQVNAWDRLLIENGEKITSLHNDMEKVKADQQRLEHELDYIVAQQRELEDMLVPLEETVAAQQQGSIYTQHADLERERTYQLAENTDGQLKRMVQDLKDIIDHLNTANTPMDSSDPMNQIAKILNAHMDSLQWIDQNSVMLQRKVDEVAKQCDVVRRDQERNVHLAFD